MSRARRSPRSSLATFALVLASTLVSASAGAVGEVRAAQGHFVDGTGAVLVLRGINVAGDSKVPPFRPAADPAIFAPLPDLGFNAVRLLFTWEAYEPTRGGYDASYLAYYVAAVRAAAAKGLFVIVDFHQDGYARFALDGCGEGAPSWAVPSRFAKDVPDNGPACEGWGLKLVQDEENHALFSAFFADEEGVRTAYLDMLARVAKALADEPGVIGYDVMNEPWSDDEATELSKLHADATTVLREASPQAIVFVSPRAFTSSGTQTALPPPSFSNAAYAPHYYDGGLLLLGSWGGIEPEAPFANMTGKAKEWGVPLFLGEFGAPAGTNRGLDYLDMIYRRLDEGFHSGAHWVYTPGWTVEKKDGWNLEDLSIVDDHGRLRDNFRVRPHPRRIAGIPTGFVVTHEPPTLTMTWEHSPSLGETLAFVPMDRWLGGPPSIEATGVACSLNDDILRCVGEAAGPVTVTVRRSSAPLPLPEEGGCALGREPRAERTPWLALVALATVLRRQLGGRNSAKRSSAVSKSNSSIARATRRSTAADAVPSSNGASSRANDSASTS
jgi:endoglycosylceramidase